MTAATRLSVSGMSCAGCVATVEDAINSVAGVSLASVNFAEHTATIEGEVNAESLVDACRYAPRGRRSYGPWRALLYAGADYPENANDTVLALAMIETEQALENLDGIMSTPGLDGIYIGPADLSLSLGCAPTLDPTEPRVTDFRITRLSSNQLRKSLRIKDNMISAFRISRTSHF